MKLVVDHDQRFAKMRAHTATHLLHAELAKIFPTTKQAGSMVDNDVLRFDFNTDRLLTPQEITTIEKHINQTIYDALPVVTTETSMAEASKLGAKAFFEDKYGDTVRVVQIQNVSAELCGGTHVNNTSDIGCFAIVAQEAVASGVKRISAVTGPKVSERMQEIQSILDTTVAKLGIKTHTQLVDKLEKTLKECDEMASKLESVEAQIIVQELQNFKSPKHEVFAKVINVSSSPILKNMDFKNIVFHAKSVFPKEDVIIYTFEGGYAIITSKADSSAKIIAQDFGLKGGGSEALFQGRDPKVLTLFK
ncbi:MAG: hypothetical protein CO170_01840 [candidate division SR1 bacterium CG_4_9_14_3_um_filter_40_9]|nr:MAG: hypothetical protein CO170_01840 [candidate division SR1 bacterium CG_4_9_14_3_um_filter_40_9]